MKTPAVAKRVTRTVHAPKAICRKVFDSTGYFMFRKLISENTFCSHFGLSAKTNYSKSSKNYLMDERSSSLLRPTVASSQSRKSAALSRSALSGDQVST